MEAKMETIPAEPRSLIFSARLYQALLAVYPVDFRQDYSGQMLQVFRDSSRRALRESGAAELASLWGRTLVDTLQTAIEEHSQRGVEIWKLPFSLPNLFHSIAFPAQRSCSATCYSS
jgi:hypothetical protein